MNHSEVVLLPSIDHHTYPFSSAYAPLSLLRTPGLAKGVKIPTIRSP